MRDRVWMLYRKASGFYYSPPAKSASECWRNAAEWEAAQNGGYCGNRHEVDEKFKRTMRAGGWRARPVSIFLDAWDDASRREALMEAVRGLTP